MGATQARHHAASAERNSGSSVAVFGEAMSYEQARNSPRAGPKISVKKSIVKRRGGSHQVSRRPRVLPSFCARRYSGGPRVCFNESVEVYEHARHLGASGGVPSDNSDVTFGLGKLLIVSQQALASGYEPQEDCWKSPEDRATILKAAMGPECYAKAWESHCREMAQLRKDRQETMLYESDWSLMPTSLAEAQRRAAKLANETKQISLENIPDGPSTEAERLAKAVAHKIAKVKITSPLKPCKKVCSARAKGKQRRLECKLWVGQVKLVRMRHRSKQTGNDSPKPM